MGLHTKGSARLQCDEFIVVQVQVLIACQTANDAKFVKEAASLHPVPVKQEICNTIS